MRWSENAWRIIQPVYNNILDLPFIKELISGSLEREKFIFYIQQDAIYLNDYGKVLMGIASRLSKAQHVESFLRFSGDSMAVEKALHLTFIKDIHQETQASPSCLLYTSYLLRQLAIAPVEVAVAAVLPCFWIYKEVGDHILEKQWKTENPYQDWINTYGGEDFAVSVQKAINIADELAGACTDMQKQAMTDAFSMCSKFEWMFWESAYNLEKWKI